MDGLKKLAGVYLVGVAVVVAVVLKRSEGAPFLGPVFYFKTIIPDSEAHPLASSAGLLHAVVRWIRGKGDRPVSSTMAVNGAFQFVPGGRAAA